MAGSDDDLFDCDPGKRTRLLAERDIDLLSMSRVFEDDRRIDFADDRRDYGEERRVTIGLAGEVLFTVAYVRRGRTIWLITAWPASRRQRALYAARRER